MGNNTLHLHLRGVATGGGGELLRREHEAAERMCIGELGESDLRA